MTSGLAPTELDELITYYDDATGERAGLSAAAIGGWAAATSALLTEGCGLGPGSQAAVLLPPHWQTAAVLLGAWSAGVEVSFRGWATAGLAPAGPERDVTFVAQRRVTSWLDEVPAGRHQFVLGFSPDAAPVTHPPEGYVDYPTAVRPYLGAAAPEVTPEMHRPATVDGTTFAQHTAIATELAHLRGIGRGDRVLIDTALHEEPLTWLLAPLTVGASIVLCANLDREELRRRIAAEQVTVVLAD
jgi:uncharacterized protein (TIGR03089 family)